MTAVSMKIHLPVPAAKVWEVVGGFNAMPDWHPLVETSELEGGGKTRRIGMPGAGILVEKLEHSDENERTYTYSIVEGPLPVSDYKATIKAVDDADGTGCTIEWSSDFEAQGNETDALTAVRGVFEAGLKNLEKMFGG